MPRDEASKIRCIGNADADPKSHIQPTPRQIGRNTELVERFLAAMDVMYRKESYNAKYENADYASYVSRCLKVHTSLSIAQHYQSYHIQCDQGHYDNVEHL